MAKRGDASITTFSNCREIIMKECDLIEFADSNTVLRSLATLNDGQKLTWGSFHVIVSTVQRVRYMYEESKGSNISLYQYVKSIGLKNPEAFTTFSLFELERSIDKMRVTMMNEYNELNNKFEELENKIGEFQQRLISDEVNTQKMLNDLKMAHWETLRNLSGSLELKINELREKRMTESRLFGDLQTVIKDNRKKGLLTIDLLHSLNRKFDGLTHNLNLDTDVDVDVEFKFKKPGPNPVKTVRSSKSSSNVPQNICAEKAITQLRKQQMELMDLEIEIAEKKIAIVEKRNDIKMNKLAFMLANVAGPVVQQQETRQAEMY